MQGCGKGSQAGGHSRSGHVPDSDVVNAHGCSALFFLLPGFVSLQPPISLCSTITTTLFFAHIITTHLPSIETGSVSPGNCQYPQDARTREQATRARYREQQEAQGARAERKTSRKTRTKQAVGSSSWPRRLTHRLSLLSQTETSELKRRALFLAGL